MDSPKSPTPLMAKNSAQCDESCLLMLPINLENFWFYIWAVIALYHLDLILQHEWFYITSYPGHAHE